MTEKLFVYGILIGRDSRAKKAELPGYEKFYRGHATIRENPEELVSGELIPVDDDFKLYDAIEGVKVNYYHRFKTNVYNIEDEKYEEAWVYQQTEDKSE